MHKVAFCSLMHQPWRMSQYTFFDIGNHKRYFDQNLNERIFRRVARKSYIPALSLMKELCEKKDFKVNLSFSGTFFEQAREYEPRVLEVLRDLYDTGHMETFGETYYHSLAFLISPEEFKAQVKKHSKMLKKFLGAKPKIFRNTESMYSDEVARAVEKLGFEGVITEGSEKILGWRDPGYPYRAADTDIQLFMRNYRLSDDIAFRFSARDWTGYPLTAGKYAHWLSSTTTPFTVIFIDFETFGEHHWEDTGIFEFLRYLPEEAKRAGIAWNELSDFLTDDFSDEIHCEDFISWADMDRDLSAWLGNEMQRAAFRRLKALEKPVKDTGDSGLLEFWRRLTTSDHVYYMSTKFAGDEEVHSYFRGEAYASAYEAFTNFMNILQDLETLVKD